MESTPLGLLEVLEMQSNLLKRGPWVSLVISFMLAVMPVVAFFHGGFLAHIEGNKTLADTLVVLPYFLLGISAFLGWKMNQLSIAFSALVFAVCYLMLAPPIEPNFVVKIHALSFVIPLCLMFIFMIRPGRLLGTAGLYMLAVTVFPLGSLRLLLRSNPEGLAQFFSFQLPHHLSFWTLPDLSLAAVAGFLVISLRERDKDIRLYSLSLLFCMPALFVVLNELGRAKAINSNLLAMFFASIGMVCVYAMYQVYWQKIYIDQLTEIPNRRALDEALMRMGRIYTIVMVDIDFFKQFNDNYGHEEGDNVLRFVAIHLSNSSGGRAYRYGGEEFCLLFDGKDADETFPVVDEIRESLAERDFFIRAPRPKDSKPTKKPVKEAPRTVKVTISMGVASPSELNAKPEAVRKAADRSLYEAKAQGRNKVVIDLGQEMDSSSSKAI